MNYFAYGSNMSLNRIRERAPSVVHLGTFQLRKHELRFHKHGRDDSGKCDAYYTGDTNSIVFGVLYSILQQEKVALDRAEGLGNGYEEKEIIVFDEKGNSHQAFMYYATHINPSLPPFTWYKEHVLVGAREAKLPDQYIATIEGVHVVQDHDRTRESLQLAIHR